MLVRKMQLFRRNKKIRQNCSNLVSKCAARSNLENEYTHLIVSFTNSGVIGILMRRNMCFSAAIVIERLTGSTRTRINAAHVMSKLSQGDSKNFYPLAHGGFTWEIHVRYNNSNNLYFI